MTKTSPQLESFAPASSNDVQARALSSHVYSDLMPQTFAPQSRAEMPRVLNFSPDIYGGKADVPLSAAQIKPILDKASGITITSPEQNQKSGQQPDFILGSDGRLRANPNKTTPSKDGSVNIEVQSSNKSEIDSKKLANQLQKAAIKDLISYFKRDNPTGKVPQDWLDQLNQEPDLPPPAEPLNTQPAQPVDQPPADQPNPPPPQDLPQAPQPVDSGSSGGGSSGGSDSGGGSSGGGSSGGDGGGGSSGGGSGDSGISSAGSDAPAPAYTGPVANGDLAIAGPPTITPDKINEVLNQYHSPAAGLGQYIYDEGVKNGINPAVALAFFVQESSCGTAGIAVENHSWGNIRGDGPGGFKHYDTWQQGVDDWYRLIKDQYLKPQDQGGFGANTLSEVIHHYAPSSDHNNEQAYVNNVTNMVHKWQTA